MMDSLASTDISDTMVSPTFSTMRFLRISDNNYRDFLHTLPLFASSPCHFHHHQFEQEGFLQEFSFGKHLYQLSLQQGETVLDDGSRVKLPLPHRQDNDIKSILLDSLSLQFQVGGFYQIGSERISQLLSIIRNNALKSGQVYSVDQVVKCLYKLEHAKLSLREEPNKSWHSLPWIVRLDFGPIDYPFYETLNEY